MAPGLRAQRVPMREREPHNTKAGGEEDGRRVAMEADEVRRKTGQLARRLAKELRSIPQPGFSGNCRVTVL